MKLYADLPARRMRQLGFDAVLVAWIIIWSVVGMTVHDQTFRQLRQPTDRMHQVGGRLHDNMTDAADVVVRVPMVGQELRVPFDRVAGVGTELQGVAAESAATAYTYSRWLGVLIALFPISLALALCLPARLRGIRDMGQVATLARADDGDELLALRALVHQPVGRLRGISSRPVADWRAGDTQVIAELAALELRGNGVRRRRRTRLQPVSERAPGQPAASVTRPPARRPLPRRRPS